MSFFVPFFAALESRTEVRMEWLHAPPLWVTVLIIVPAVCLATYWLYRAEASLSLGKRLLLTALRVLGILTIIIFLFEPILTRERVQRENSYILVLIDDSYSMGIKDRYGDAERVQALGSVIGRPLTDDTTRLDLVRAILSSTEIDLIHRLRQKGNVRIVSCSDGVRRIADLPRTEAAATDERPWDLSELELTGKVTRLGDSIYEAVSDLRGESIAAVILLSDGRDNAGVMRPEEAANRLGKRDTPLHVVGVGNDEEPKDVRVFGLDIAEVVLERDLVTVDFNIMSRGFEGELVDVQLKIRDRENPGAVWEPAVRPRPIRMEADGEIQPVRLEFRPRLAGRYIARVEVERQEGELFEENNFEEKPLTVLSQRIKLLYIDGPPRWEYRYLTWAVTRDPTMEAQVLLTSADPKFIQESSNGVKPLRRLPQTKEELFEYHLVMIGDVPPDTFSRDQKEWLLEFVDELGGGVVFLAGPWYMPRKYRGDPLERLFPVELEDAADYSGEIRDRTNVFHLKLTPEGKEHPVMQLVGDPKENERLWEFDPRGRGLPGMFWSADVKQLKRFGVALAVKNDAGHFKYGPRPIFAFQYLGRGRTFVSLVDSTWRWRRHVGNRWFYRFWGQVIRFTSAGRLLGETKRFALHTDQREYTLGNSIRIRAKVLDREFKPTKEEDVSIFWEKAGDLDGERREIRASQVAARPEYYEATVEARDLGEHRVWIEERDQEVATYGFRVIVPQLETSEPRMDRPRLEQIAQISGGTYYDVSAASEIPDEVRDIQRNIPIQSESKSLWDSAWFLLLFAALITVEWVLRKVFRLL